MMYRGIFVAAVVVLAVGLGCRGLDRDDPQVLHLAAPGALGPYSGAVRAGRLWFLSGKVGDASTRRAEVSFEEEAASSLDEVEAELARAGLTLEDVVSVTVYLTDMGLYSRFNAIYAERFTEPYPARACIGVASLPGSARVEIQATARDRRRGR